MRKLTTLTGKNLPKLSVAKPGWPTLADDLRAEEELQRRRFVHATRPKHPLSMEEAIELHKRMEGFTRVCDQMGLSERLRKD